MGQTVYVTKQDHYHKSTVYCSLPEAIYSDSLSYGHFLDLEPVCDEFQVGPAARCGKVQTRVTGQVPDNRQARFNMHYGFYVQMSCCHAAIVLLCCHYVIIL